MRSKEMSEECEQTVMSFQRMPKEGAAPCNGDWLRQRAVICSMQTLAHSESETHMIMVGDHFLLVAAATNAIKLLALFQAPPHLAN